MLPALDNGQFALFAEQGSILGYFSWAMLSPETEAQYLQSDSVLHTPANWQSGSRIWIVDWFAPYGDSLKIKTLTRRYLFSNQPEAYALYHRAEPGKARIVRFAGRLGGYLKLKDKWDGISSHLLFPSSEESIYK